jgi:hypothetical protein
MPHFFLHLHDDIDLPDYEGIEAVDLSAARKHAKLTALDLMCGVIKAEGRIVLHHRIDIEDEEGRVLDTVRFADVVTVEA